MTLGIDMTSNEPEKGWPDTTPTIHPQNHILALALSAWKIASQMVDEHRDWDDIARMQETASILEDLANEECTCTPNYDCTLCKAVASLIYDEDYKESK